MKKISAKQNKGIFISSLIGAALLAALDDFEDESHPLKVNLDKLEPVVSHIYNLTKKSLETDKQKDNFANSVPFYETNPNVLIAALRTTITLQDLEKFTEFKMIKDKMNFNFISIAETARGSQLATKIIKSTTIILNK